MNTKLAKISLTKQDWENFNMYCITTQIDKSRCLTMILHLYLVEQGIKDKDDEDMLFNLCNYQPKKAENLKYNHNYKDGKDILVVRIEENSWNLYTKHCKDNNLNKNGLLNCLINRFLYSNFPSIYEDIKVDKPIKFINKKPWLIEPDDVNYDLYDIYNQETQEWSCSNENKLKTNIKEQDDYKYVYNSDGSLKYKANTNIQGNQAADNINKDISEDHKKQIKIAEETWKCNGCNCKIFQERLQYSKDTSK